MNQLPPTRTAEQRLVRQLEEMQITTQNTANSQGGMDVDHLAADLGQCLLIAKPASIAFDQWSVHHAPPNLLNELNLWDCPKIVWHAHEFVWPTLEWVKIRRFEFNQAYFDILSEYQRVTNTSIHWRAVLEAGRELIYAAYLAYEHPDHRRVVEGASVYRGPSRSQKEFDARVQIWKVKTEVWEATIRFANSTLQDAVQLVEAQLDDALINEKKHGLFEPWQEYAPSKQLKDQIEHTRHLPNPFDPILLDGMTMADLAQMEDA
ncbi:hypothetical protein PMZ80_008606 [Knufia obscura]|uniref:Uncharacterized protein n=2 Tax=Knufia TaxID=430999 RepID=A0AAN8EJ58_9EURO|nr:hypothetical protein PMZ80_008606 [Knufia obscura]KAK5952062.1 hypothetical protein OHC33_006949 [Knufia fluminis]